MGLIEGLGDAVDREYERLRAEIKDAIISSDYTVGQVAVLADIGEGTLYRILSGQHFPQLDTLLRIAFVLGVRIEIAHPEGEGARPFQVVPNESPSTGRRRSTSSSSQSKGNLSETEKRKRKPAAAKQAKPAPRKTRQTSWFEHPARDLDEYRSTRDDLTESAPIAA